MEYTSMDSTEIAGPVKPVGSSSVCVDEKQSPRFSAAAAGTVGAGDTGYELRQVQVRDEGRLAAVDPPRLVKDAEVERVEADRVVDRGHCLLGGGIVTCECQGTPARCSGRPA